MLPVAAYARYVPNKSSSSLYGELHYQQVRTTDEKTAADDVSRTVAYSSLWRFRSGRSMMNIGRNQLHHSASWFDAIRSTSKIRTEVERRRDLPKIGVCRRCTETYIVDLADRQRHSRSLLYSREPTLFPVPVD
eukprot:scaffold200407_cov49-Attheya_sp.AAC.4